MNIIFLIIFTVFQEVYNKDKRILLHVKIIERNLSLLCIMQFFSSYLYMILNHNYKTICGNNVRFTKKKTTIK